VLQLEQLERQYHALLARGVKDIPSWVDAAAEFVQHMNEAPVALSPERLKLRAWGVL
jgi:hypothetical protein